MAGHSRSKNGVASLAYVPAIHILSPDDKDVDARDERGHDGDRVWMDYRAAAVRVGDWFM
jgi:hypothetical protein